MTIETPSAVKKILENGGHEDGFFFPLVYSYRSVGGGKVLYALFTGPEYDDMDTSPYVADAVCLMANGVLTLDGQRFVDTA
tara:strand:- start:420 stop:662 length:243 start_codon:yes stop_codon:yes gene_type:complete